MKKTGVINKKAFFVNGLDKTGYIFDESYEAKDSTLLWSDTKLRLFDKNTGKTLMRLDGSELDVIWVNTLEQGFTVTLNEKEHFYNYQGKRIASANSIIVSKNGIVAKIENNVSVFSYNGKNILSGNNIEVHMEDKAVTVKKDGLWGAYSYEGKCILPIKYQRIICRDEGITIDRKDYPYTRGLYSYDCNTIVSEEYSIIYFHDVGIQVMLGQNIGIYSYQGKQVIPVKYDTIHFYESGIVTRIESGKYGLYSKDGNMILDDEYDSIKNIKDDIFLVEKDNKLGIYSTVNNEIFPTQFDSIRNLGKEVILRKNNLEGLYTIDGKEILSMNYNRILLENQLDGVYSLYEKGDNRWKSYIKSKGVFVEGDELLKRDDGYYVKRNNVWEKVE